MIVSPFCVRSKEPLFLLLPQRFDVLVNGGGSITLQFQRAHFEPLTVTVAVPWNQIVVLDPIEMQLKNHPKKASGKDPGDVWSLPCGHHSIRPQIIAPFSPSQIGGDPTPSSSVFVESQVINQFYLISGSLTTISTKKKIEREFHL